MASVCTYSGSVSASSNATIARERITRPATCDRSGRIGYCSAIASRKPGSSLVVAAKCSCSPSNRKTFANRPSQIRAALRTIVSNTGWRSLCELLMTPRISAVAVWRSSASLVSLNRRTFSIAITAWLAKVLSRSTSRSANAPGSVRVTVIAPTISRSRSIGTLSRAR